MKRSKMNIRVMAWLALLVTFTLACAITPNLENVGEQVKDKVLETVGSISGDAIGNIESTAQAIPGAISPELQATLAAIPPGITIGKAPADIPVIPDPYGFLGGEKQVAYMTTVSLDDAVQFYRQQMPANGWQETEPSMVVPKIAYITFEKDGRKATLGLTPAGDKLAVSITITEK